MRIPTCILALFLAALSVETGPVQADEPVDFDTEIQPILAARCIHCHGPGQAEAGLRLDDGSHATAVLESEHRAIVPGDPAGSELLRRVQAEEFERMPPEGKPLTPQEIAKLKQWIAAGAHWPAHWAYRPLMKPALPDIASSDLPAKLKNWPRNEIDPFVLRKLIDKKLTPSEPADRRTLLRRLNFDLIGMPPTPEEMESFLKDTRPDAYERVVDQLLASPHYGERWARHWMDTVHYADSHGFEHDVPREIWPYRDYLVRSFNEDKPYARFVMEQVAGDVLYPGNRDALVATGFLATGPWDLSSLQSGNANSINHTISQYLDRDDIVSTVISTFVSTTVHCARCHDHKFDPVQQEDYYSLQAVFAGIDKAERLYDADPATAERRQNLKAQIAALPQLKERLDAELLAPALHAEIAAWEAEHKKQTVDWTLPAMVSVRSAEGATLLEQADGSVLSTENRPEKDTYLLTVDSPLEKITAVRLQVLADESLPQSGPGRQENGNLHLSEIVVTVSPLAEPENTAIVEWQETQADFNQTGWGIERAIDGNPSTAWGIYPEVGKSHEAIFVPKEPIAKPGGSRLTIELQQLHGQHHLIGRPRITLTGQQPSSFLSDDPLPLDITAILDTKPAQRTNPQKAALAAFYLERKLTGELTALPPQDKIYCGTNQFEGKGGLQPAATPREVHILERGEITKPTKLAVPGTLSCLEDLPARFELSDPQQEGSRRAALARWIVAQENVLTWRSIANRVWRYHFDRGLVTTPNDFGRMGAAPSHPELLDWLAVTLRDGGGSLKSLHRLIVTSATYRQASTHDEAAAKIDADNRFLWRMNRRRLDAEAVHDAMLRISGELDPKMGGPPVEQFVKTKTFGLRPEVDYTAYDLDAPGANRRSLYRFHLRTMPDPFMEALDCPNGTQLAPKRTESITAIQALAMKNDRFVIRQSEKLAERLAGRTGDPKEQIQSAYQLIFNRLPTGEEQAAVTQYAEKFGLASACRMLLNTNEFLFLD